MLCHEMDLRHDYLNYHPADTLYIGGGTPTVLPPDVLEKMIDHAREVFGLNPQAEITLEANPNNLDEEYIKRLSDTSVNRLSIGIQSFYDDNLLVLGRIHTGRQAETSLELAYKYGFENLSIDLMYGYPHLSEDRWRENLERVKAVAHLSCYSLSLEMDSRLYKQIQAKRYPLPDEDEVIKQYELLTDFAAKNNFIHYEMSNFCKSGRFSKHNTAYWQDKIYIGIGPSAHSFNRVKRQWNLADLHSYIRQIRTIHTPEQWELTGKDLLFSSEALTSTMRVNEYIMTSLRTIWGCDLKYVRAQFGESFYVGLREKIEAINPQWYILEDNKLILTTQGRLLTDAIARDLFF
jgi:oxygen-independent coproporphyrinogen-3 oxidase